MRKIGEKQHYNEPVGHVNQLKQKQHILDNLEKKKPF